MSALQKRLAKLQKQLASTPVEYQGEIKLSIKKVEAVLAERAKKANH